MAEYEQAVTAQAEAADEVETAAIQLAVLEEQLSVARDVVALMEAHERIRTPLTGKNAEDREAEFLVRLYGADGWERARDEVAQCKATVETARAALERKRMRRQEKLWNMRYLAGLSMGPVDEL